MRLSEKETRTYTCSVALFSYRSNFDKNSSRDLLQVARGSDSKCPAKTWTEIMVPNFATISGTRRI